MLKAARQQDDDGANRRTASLAGLAATLFIFVLALVIVRKLQVRCMLEECLSSGRPGCEYAVDRLRVSLMFSGHQRGE
ncbi:MAG: hypothetical protein WDN49_14940 [Acetobacteraceae bacterium]